MSNLLFKICEDCPCPEIVERYGKCFDCIGVEEDQDILKQEQEDDYDENSF
jgi:hypothetical protein